MLFFWETLFLSSVQFAFEFFFFFQKTSIFNLHIEANNCSVLPILKHYERHTDKNKNHLFCMYLQSHFRHQDHHQWRYWNLSQFLVLRSLQTRNRMRKMVIVQMFCEKQVWLPLASVVAAVSIYCYHPRHQLHRRPQACRQPRKTRRS